MRATVVKKFHIDAAHWLPDYDGPCGRLHGHRWDILVGLTGLVGRNGMVVDFSWIKESMGEILEPLDHHCLNDTIENPTAENLAAYLFGVIKDDWIQSPDEPVQLGFVRVYETPDAYAEVRG